MEPVRDEDHSSSLQVSQRLNVESDAPTVMNVDHCRLEPSGVAIPVPSDGSNMLLSPQEEALAPASGQPESTAPGLPGIENFDLPAFYPRQGIAPLPLAGFFHPNMLSAPWPAAQMSAMPHGMSMTGTHMTGTPTSSGYVGSPPATSFAGTTTVPLPTQSGIRITVPPPTHSGVHTAVSPPTQSGVGLRITVPPSTQSGVPTGVPMNVGADVLESAANAAESSDAVPIPAALPDFDPNSHATETAKYTVVAPERVTSYVEKHFRKPLPMEQWRGMCFHSPRPQTDAMQVPTVDSNVKSWIGPAFPQNLDRMLTSCQFDVLAAVGPLTNLWERLPCLRRGSL